MLKVPWGASGPEDEEAMCHASGLEEMCRFLFSKRILTSSRSCCYFKKVTLDFQSPVGSKEVLAWLPHLLEARTKVLVCMLDGCLMHA
jgi:hypothetical protein